MRANGESLPRRRIYLGGAEVEVWENPDVHFGASPADLRSYLEQGSWIALFNAMTLASAPDSRHELLPSGAP